MKTHKMKPILFSAPMVRAILAGEKTVTRRVIKQEYVDDALSSPARKSNPDIPDEKFVWCLCDAPYEPGDILWVREAWCDPTPDQRGCPILYKADMPMHWDAEDTECGTAVTLKAEDYKWRPSIFMPRAAARIFLRVVNVWAERLNSIRDVGVIAEGIDRTVNRTMGQRRLAFADLWNSINAKRDGGAYAWERNPWVWVIEFERVADRGWPTWEKGGLTI